MKNKFVLGVSTVVTVCAVVACGQKKDSKSKSIAPVRSATEQNKPTPEKTAPPASADKKEPGATSDKKATDPKVDSRPETADFSTPNVEPAGAPNHRSEHLPTKQLVAKDDCAKETPIEFPKTGEKTWKALVDKKEGRWEFAEAQVWLEVENNKTRLVNKLSGTADYKSEVEPPPTIKLNTPFDQFTHVKCHTAKDLVETGLKSSTESEENRTLRLKIDSPKAIDRKTGKIEFFRTDVWEAFKNQTRNTMSIYPQALDATTDESVDGNKTKKDSVLSVERRFVVKENVAEVYTQTTESFINSNFTWRTIQKVTYKTIGSTLKK